MRPQVIVVMAAIALLTMGVQTVGAVMVRISQESSPGAGDFDAGDLGCVETVSSALDVVSYYDWNLVSTTFLGPAPAPQHGVSYLFVLNTTSTNTLSIVMVHDSPGQGGGHAETSIAIAGDPDGAAWLVKDDPENIGTVFDTYTGSPGDNLFTANHTWGDCCTDGGAVGTLEGNWSVLVEFTATPTNLTSWRAYTGTGAEVSLALTPGRRVLIEPCQPVQNLLTTWGAMKSLYR